MALFQQHFFPAKLRGCKRTYCKLTDTDARSVCMIKHEYIKHFPLQIKPQFCYKVLCTVHQHNHIEQGDITEGVTKFMLKDQDFISTD